MNLRTVSAAAGFSLLSVLCVRADEKEYSLKLEKPAKAGDRLQVHYKATIEESRSVTVGDDKLSDEASDTQVELRGVDEVLEAGEKGNVKKRKFTVESFSLHEEDKAPQEPCGKGAVITVEAVEKGEDKILIDGKPVSKTVDKVLGALFNVTADGRRHTDDDKVYGTDKPRKAGSEWTLDSELLLQEMPEELPYTIAPETTKGRMKFPEVKTIDGREYCLLKLSIELKPTAIKDLPKNFKITGAAVKISGDMLAPVDAALPPARETLNFEMTLNGMVPTPAGDAKVSTYVRTTREAVNTVVK